MSDSESPRLSLFAVKRLAPRLRPHRKALVGAGICLLLSTAIGLAFPLVVRYLMDAAFVERNASLLGTIALGLLGLFVLQGVFNFGETYWLGATGERVIARLRTDLFSKLIGLSLGFHAGQATGELTSRLASDCSMLQSIMGHQIAELIRQIMFLVGSLVLLTLLHWQLMFTTLAVAPVVVLAGFAFGRLLRRRSTEVQDRLAEANAVADEAFGQVEIVQSFVREDWERQRYGVGIGRALDSALARAMVRALLFGVLTIAAFGGIVLVLWQGGRLVVTAQITAGQLVSFLLYAFSVAAAIMTLGSLWTSYQEAQGAARRVFDLLDRRTVIVPPQSPVSLAGEGPPAVAFEGVSFRYGEDEPWALEEIDATIASGEVVALVGPSGAGKTTFASLVPRFWDVTEGHIRLRGVDVRDCDLADLRSRIGIVPQDHPLFAGTIAENIAYGRPEADRAAVEAAAEAAHAREFISRLREGYETMVGERGVRLSGGQRQRIAIARVPAQVAGDLDSGRSHERSGCRKRGTRGEGATSGLGRSHDADYRASPAHGSTGGSPVDPRSRATGRDGTHEMLLNRGGLYARLYRGQQLT